MSTSSSRVCYGSLRTVVPRYHSDQEPSLRPFRPLAIRPVGLIFRLRQTTMSRRIYSGVICVTDWPLDHLLLSKPEAARLNRAGVDRELRGDEEASDHASAWH